MFCVKSKNLYNRVCFLVRSHLDYNRRLIGSYEMMDILRNEPVFRALPSHTSQQIVKAVRATWRAYLMALKAYKEDPSRFEAKPRPPKYKRRNQQYPLFFTKYQLKVKGKTLVFPKQIGLRVNIGKLAALFEEHPLQIARLIPKGHSYVLELVYRKHLPDIELPPTEEEEIIANARRIAAVDLGVNNLLTWTNNIGLKPIIVKGGRIKSTVRYFNKQLAQLKSQYDRQGHKTGPKLRELKQQREQQMSDLLHKASHLLVEICRLTQIDTLVIGYNPGWKQNTELGKVTNQNFVGVPFFELVEKIKYKAHEAGIAVLLPEEGYTSKCSFLDDEPLEYKESYAGRRVHRGLFRSRTGVLLNADCNGSANCGRKVFPLRFRYGIVDAVNHPLRLSVKTSTGELLQVLGLEQGFAPSAMRSHEAVKAAVC